MCRLPVTTCFGLVLLLLLNGCATTAPYNPFSVAKEEIYKTLDNYSGEYSPGLIQMIMEDLKK